MQARVRIDGLFRVDTLNKFSNILLLNDKMCFLCQTLSRAVAFACPWPVCKEEVDSPPHMIEFYAKFAFGLYANLFTTAA